MFGREPRPTVGFKRCIAQNKCSGDERPVHCTSVLFYCCTTVLLCYTAVLLYYCTTVLLTVLLLDCIVLLLYCTVLVLHTICVLGCEVGSWSGAWSLSPRTNPSKFRTCAPCSVGAFSVAVQKAICHTALGRARAMSGPTHSRPGRAGLLAAALPGSKILFPSHVPNFV